MDTTKLTQSPTLTDEERQRISRAISDPTRFDVFKRIAAGHCVACTDIREQLAVTAPTISHHLRELEAAGLIRAVREGKFVSLHFRREIWQAYLNELSSI